MTTKTPFALPSKMRVITDDGRISQYWSAYFDSLSSSEICPGNTRVLTDSRLFSVHWVQFLTKLGKNRAPFHEPVIYDNGLMTLPWLIFFGIVSREVYPTLPEASISASTQASEHTLLNSPFKFIETVGLSSPFTDSTTAYSYTQTLLEAASLAARFPRVVTFEDVAILPSGNKITALRIRDTGNNPLVVISTGIHGDERDGVPGMMRFATEYALATLPSIAKIANTVGLIIILSVNADGVVDNTRNNRNHINLNRNFPWFWPLEDDLDKGASVSSEPETVGVQNWSLDFVNRVYVAVDTHGWTSQVIWGFLIEQIYWHQEGEVAHRRAYHYINNLVTKRDWSRFTIVNDQPTLAERKSHEKPYLYNWFRNRGNPKAVVFLIEAPQTENPGVTSTVFMDVLLGAVMTAMDMYAAPRLSGFEVTPDLTVVNSNSDFSGWNTPENRPDFFSYGKCSLSNHVGNTFDMTPYYSLGWSKVLRSSTMVIASDSTALSVAGVTLVGAQTACYKCLPDGSMATSNAFPISVQELAAATNGSTVWAYGGIDGSTTYQAGLYSKSITGSDSWVFIANVTNSGIDVALQRHEMVYYGGYLYIIGGRTLASVSKAIYKVNPATGVATLLVNMPSNTQRHTVALYGSILYVFGGDAGITIRTTIYKVNLVAGTVSTLSATLPAAVINSTCVYSADEAYIAFGNTDTAGTIFVSTIFKFVFSTETITTISYTLDSYENDEGNTIYVREPLVARGCGYYDTRSDTPVFVGGDSALGLTDIVWELNGTMLSTRGSVLTTHSYIRSRQAFTTALDEEYVLVANVTSNSVMNDFSACHAAAVLIVGPLSSPSRVSDNVRRVPSYTKTPLFMPVKIRPGETGASMLRMYVRFWHSSSSIKFSDGMQLLKCGSSKAVAAFGLISGTSRAETSYSSYDMEGIFSPFWGAKTPINQVVLDFTTFELWYVANDSDLVDPNGYFQLKWTNDAGAQTYDFPIFRLNLSKSVQDWRRDSVCWKVTGATTFSIWWYGNIYSKTMDTPAPSSWVSNGAGILVGI